MTKKEEHVEIDNSGLGVKDKDGDYYVYIKETNEPFSGELTYFFENGNKRIIYTHFNGREHGLRTSYYENGQIESETYIVNKSSNGSYIEYYENGQKKRRVL